MHRTDVALEPGVVALAGTDVLLTAACFSTGVPHERQDVLPVDVLGLLSYSEEGRKWNFNVIGH